MTTIQLPSIAHQFIVNANGALYERIGRENLSWDPKGVGTTGHLGKDLWSVEIFVPYGIFDQVVLPATGTVWYGNFTRHRGTDRKNREYQGFNVITGAPSHNQNAFGPLRAFHFFHSAGTVPSYPDA